MNVRSPALRVAPCLRRQRNGGSGADRSPLAECLKRGAATAVVLACLAVPAASHEPDDCFGWQVAMDLGLRNLEEASRKVVRAAEADADIHTLKASFVEYMDSTAALVGAMKIYVRCAELRED